MAKGMMMAVLVVELVILILILGLASWSLDMYIDGRQNHPHLGGNAATNYMLIFALLGGTTGVASIIVGYSHYRAWKVETMAAAASSAAIAWAMMGLAFGLAWKEVTLGGPRGKYLRTLEIFILISTLIQMFYLMALHAGNFNQKYGPSYGRTGPQPAGEGPSGEAQKSSGNEPGSA